MENMIAIASDHGGFAMKNQLLEHLKAKGVAVVNLGCYSQDSVDYPIYAEKVGRGVADGTYERGILVCGTGIGMSIAANKIPGVRASLCADCYSAEMTRVHNDSNVLCLGGRTIGIELAKRIVDTYLAADFSQEEKHVRRVAMIQELEK
jgi:ribose 5-phosphate isomerase B